MEDRRMEYEIVEFKNTVAILQEILNTLNVLAVVVIVGTVLFFAGAIYELTARANAAAVVTPVNIEQVAGVAVDSPYVKPIKVKQD